MVKLHGGLLRSPATESICVIISKKDRPFLKQINYIVATYRNRKIDIAAEGNQLNGYQKNHTTMDLQPTANLNRKKVNLLSCSLQD